MKAILPSEGDLFKLVNTCETGVFIRISVMKVFAATWLAAFSAVSYCADVNRVPRAVMALDAAGCSTVNISILWWL